MAIVVSSQMTVINSSQIVDFDISAESKEAEYGESCNVVWALFWFRRLQLARS